MNFLRIYYSVYVSKNYILNIRLQKKKKNEVIYRRKTGAFYYSTVLTTPITGNNNRYILGCTEKKL